ncbi:MAG: antiviral reverse transcriptase Drt5 [Candidatus Zixiibacteriota bacterium]
MSSYENTVGFFLEDHPRTLFPLDTNRILVEKAAKEVGDFVYQKITPGKKADCSFLSQTRAYASKPGFHVRRTLKLDPVAEFFLYDLIYRYRNCFRKNAKDTRLSFGYRFEQGGVISPTESYRLFKAGVHDASKQYQYGAKFDISCYFNSVYHHDLVKWFRDAGAAEDDVMFFDKFLKQINAGRSVDCLPHGLMPAKLVGSHFLTFVDNSNRVNCELLLRFMDDFYLYSDDVNTVISDFVQIQKMLGEKGLSINPSKTQLGAIKDLDIRKEVDQIKVGLLRKRRKIILVSGEQIEEEEEVKEKLSEEEEKYLFSLLQGGDIEEEDAELVLSLMRDHGSDILQYIPMFLYRFPNLNRNIYYFCGHVPDKEGLGGLVYDFLRKFKNLTDYQLFWIGMIAEKQLQKTARFGDILSCLFEHPNASTLSRAKILEVPEKRFGMGDLREEHLRTGASDWLSWASAVGSRVEKKANRNHLLGYFSNCSPMNKLVADCVMKL